MGSMINEETPLENGNSLLIPPPKYKRRKISAIRTFPPGCGPNAAVVCEQTKAVEVQGVNELNVDDVVNVVLNDIENCSEEDGLCEPESKGLDEKMVQPVSLNEVESKTSTLALSSKVKNIKEELENLSAENTNTFDEIGTSKVKPIIKNEEYDSSHELVEASPELRTTLPHELVEASLELRTTLPADDANKITAGEGSSVEQHLLPYYPIPPNLVWKERKYPPRRKVSAIRTFPDDCGPSLTRGGIIQVVEGTPDTKMQETNLPNHNEGDLEGYENCADKVQIIVSGGNEDSGEKMITQAAVSGQSSETKGREKSVEDNEEKHKQNIEKSGQSSETKRREKSVEDNEEKHTQNIEKSGCSGKDEMYIENSPDWLEEDVMVYVKDKSKKKKSVGVSEKNIESQEQRVGDTEIEKGIAVQGLMCAASSPWSQVKSPAKPSPFRASVKESKGKKKRSPTKGINSAKKVVEESTMIVPYVNEMEIDEISRPLARSDDEDSSENEERNDFQFLPRPRDCEVTPPPFMIGSSSEKGSPRSKVRETLRLFQTIVRKLIQGEEAKPKEKGKPGTRVDILAANMLKAKGRYINTDKVIGPFPGVEIGDIFSYRMELAVIGLHTPLQGGIDTTKQGKGRHALAVSVVASGGYDNDVDSSDVLIYTGQGGNPVGAEKQREDQKLERGNLALKNCIDGSSPVRVIRGFKESKSVENSDGRSKTVATYTYDGLYTVEKYWQDVGPHGKLVYKFELRRIPGQRQLAWKEVKQSKKCKVREDCCVDDISQGKEKPRICAVNSIDDEKPPPFTYITRMMYPDWCLPLPLTGCHCKGVCSDSDRCACAVKNGGEIPYNSSGAIVEAKPLVYECGPSCKCPPSCSNRVSQHGIKLPLEIFKTESRGWGVRCMSSIPSGTFICEYIGELLDDKEAEQRAGSDEYLFDIGQNFGDPSLSDGLSAVMPDMPIIATDVVENVGFTIDAAKFGNIGRFINHSCTPNLYAQNVLYDYEDKRTPHIMMFAAENIPPLQELTYHYNYTIDHVSDSQGNIKKKSCYCGSVECSGRMY